MLLQVLAKRLEMNTAEGVPESESFDAHYRGSEDSTSGVHFSKFYIGAGRLHIVGTPPPRRYLEVLLATANQIEAFLELSCQRRRAILHAGWSIRRTAAKVADAAIRRKIATVA